MLIEQTHFVKIGPPWGKIVIGSMMAITAGIIVYKLCTIKPIKIVLKPKKENEPGPEIFLKTKTKLTL